MGLPGEEINQGAKPGSETGGRSLRVLHPSPFFAFLVRMRNPPLAVDSRMCLLLLLLVGREFLPRPQVDDVVLHACLEESGKLVEVRAWLDEPGGSLQCLLVNDLLEGHKGDVQLARCRDHMSVQTLVDDGLVPSDAQLGPQHHVERVGGTASALIPQLDAHALLCTTVPLFVPLRDLRGHHLPEVNLPQRHVAVLVPADCLQSILREVLGEPFCENNGSVVLVRLHLPSSDQVDDVVSQFLERQAAVVRQVLLLGVLDRDHQVGLSGNRSAISQPARLPPHGLDDVVRRGGQSVGPQVEHLFGHDVHCREEAEGEIDSFIVVVDRLREMDHSHVGVVGGESALVHDHQVGSSEGVVSANRDKGIDLQVQESRVHVFELLSLLGVLQVFGFLDRLSGICAGGSDDNASAVS
mmetsp:Transcript_36309/g.71433  ORF Transcript_36309/g.71433 Transcript_36309/m.71433 type:complete len:411 (+) Transcript_36309:52-1284(+)